VVPFYSVSMIIIQAGGTWGKCGSQRTINSINLTETSFWRCLNTRGPQTLRRTYITCIHHTAGTMEISKRNSSNGYSEVSDSFEETYMQKDGPEKP